MEESIEKKHDDVSERIKALKLKHAANMQSSKTKTDRMKSRKELKGNSSDKVLKGLKPSDQSLSLKHKHKNTKETITPEQKLFIKHLDFTKEQPLTAKEVALERDIQKALTEGDFDRAQSLSSEISQLHIDQTLREAMQKSTYEHELEVQRQDQKPVLSWKFARKERWERKANN